MTSNDIMNLIKASNSCHIIAVHMEAINHCRLDRKTLHNELEQAKLYKNIHIPMDGESISL
jgi:hypothetical protein